MLLLRGESRRGIIRFHLINRCGLWVYIVPRSQLFV
nr:MAG TPA: hypothetical protein [Herelleviridae sp.]